jgi:hypothetical protein
MYDSETVIRKSKKLLINENAIYFLNSNYLEIEKDAKQCNQGILKNLIQPLQVRAFDKTGKMVGFICNCMVGGFPNLNWGNYGRLDSVPPFKNSMPDTVIYFEKDFKNYKNSNGETPDINKYTDSDYNIVVFYTLFMHRQTKLLVNKVKEYVARNSSLKINVIYVNAEVLYRKSAIF